MDGLMQQQQQRGSGALQSPRNIVCRECMATSSPLAPLSPVPWEDVASEHKEALLGAAARALSAPPSHGGGRALLLYGPPGTGKTTMTKALLQAILQRSLGFTFRVGVFYLDVKSMVSRWGNDFITIVCLHVYSALCVPLLTRCIDKRFV